MSTDDVTVAAGHLTYRLERRGRFHVLARVTRRVTETLVPQVAYTAVCGDSGVVVGRTDDGTTVHPTPGPVPPDHGGCIACWTELRARGVMAPTMRDGGLTEAEVRRRLASGW